MTTDALTSIDRKFIEDLCVVDRQFMCWWVHNALTWCMEGYSLLSHRSLPADVRRIPQRLILFLACTVAYTRFPGVQMGLLCTCSTGITVISHHRRQGVQHASFFLRQGLVITCTLFAKPARQFIQAVQHWAMRSGSQSRPFSITTQDMPAGRAALHHVAGRHKDCV